MQQRLEYSVYSLRASSRVAIHNKISLTGPNKLQFFNHLQIKEWKMNKPMTVKVQSPLCLANEAPRHGGV